MPTKAKTKKRPPRRRTLRGILNEIDLVLASNTAVSQKLWDVLTALRGPDDCAVMSKLMGTVPIRRAAFPRTARSGHAPASFEGGHDGIVNSYNEEPYHFRSHLGFAADALGLVVKREDLA